ncbi:MAG: GNAT family N-acetyltransferase [Rhodospirillales bacterium]|nr:GNAT family N-acetyltransferase [Alphaproteobacteria bacterium]USO03297.1 MAG: GNAT family N-acetyltransferase [Rhodospirillales bacterium]
MNFVPDDFVVPEKLVADDFYLRMLTIHDVIKDYDAVMASREKLKSPDENNTVWPDGLTIEQNLIDLAWHQKEFQKRSSFTYTVMKPDDSQCLGCVYIYPTDKANYDSKIELWTRSGANIEGLDEILFSKVKEWISISWPFKNPAYPGREIDWKEWSAHASSS